MTKNTKASASADVGFIFIAYNLRRIINIIGKDALTAYLAACLASISIVKTKLSAYINLIMGMANDLAQIRKIKIILNTACQSHKSRNMTIINPGF